jgi:hypothetical protein
MIKNPRCIQLDPVLDVVCLEQPWIPEIFVASESLLGNMLKKFTENTTLALAVTAVLPISVSSEWEGPSLTIDGQKGRRTRISS